MGQLAHGLTAEAEHLGGEGAVAFGANEGFLDSQGSQLGQGGQVFAEKEVFPSHEPSGPSARVSPQDLQLTTATTNGREA